MSNNSVTIPVEIVDNFTKTLSGLQKSLDSLRIPEEFENAVISLAKSFEDARTELNLFSVASKALETVGLASFLAAAAVTVLELISRIKVLSNVSNTARLAFLGFGAVAGGLIAIELIGWFVNLANAAGEAARKIEKETVKALEKVHDAASGFQAQAVEAKHLAERYFELREQTSRTAAEQAELEAVSKRLAELVPAYSRQIRDLTGDYSGLATAIEGALKFDLVKNLEGLKLGKQTELFQEIFKLPETIGSELKNKLFDSALEGFDEFSRAIKEKIRELEKDAPLKAVTRGAGPHTYIDYIIDPDSEQGKLINELQQSLRDLKPEIEGYSSASTIAAEASRRFEESQQALTESQKAARAGIEQYKTTLEGLGLEQIQSRFDQLNSVLKTLKDQTPSFSVLGPGEEDAGARIITLTENIEDFRKALGEMGYTFDETGKIVKKAGEDVAQALMPLEQAQENVKASMQSMKPAITGAYEELLRIGAQVQLDGGKTLPDYADRVLALVERIKELGGQVPEATRAIVEQAQATLDDARAKEEAKQKYEEFKGTVLQFVREGGAGAVYLAQTLFGLKFSAEDLFPESDVQIARKRAETLAKKISDTVADMKANGVDASEALIRAYALYGDQIEDARGALAAFGLDFDKLPPEARKAFGDVEKAGGDMQQFMVDAANQVLFALSMGMGGFLKTAEAATDHYLLPLWHNGCELLPLAA